MKGAFGNEGALRFSFNSVRTCSIAAASYNVQSYERIRRRALADDVVQLAQELSNLRGRAVEIHTRLTEQHSDWVVSDFRRTFFVKYAAICDSAMIAYMFVGRCLMRADWWNEPNGIVSPLSTITEKEAHRTASTFFIFVRTGLTHLVFSQAETTLRAFLRTLAPHAAGNGNGEFKSVYECLMRSHLPRPEGWTDELAVLDLFRLIRNLIHNNGFFLSRHGKNETITYRGQTYVFRHGEHAKFIWIDVLLDIIGDVLILMEAVVCHFKIATYPTVMTDPVLEGRDR